MNNAGSQTGINNTNGNDNNSQIFWRLVIDVVASTLGLIAQGACGVYLTLAKHLNKPIRQTLAKMIEQVFQPCLIFSVFVMRLEIDKPQTWLPAVALSVSGVLVGFAIAWAANRAYIRDKRASGIIMLSMGLVNTTNIPLNTIAILQDYLDVISERRGYPSGDSFLRGSAYVIINTFIHIILRWTLGRKIIEMGDDSHKSEVAPQNARAGAQQDAVPPADAPEARTSLAQKVLNVMNPPLWACVVSLVTCLIPPLRAAVTTKGTFTYRALYNSTEVLAKVIFPVNLINLGSVMTEIYQKSGQGKVSKRTLIHANILKLIVCPAVTYIALVLVLSRYLDPVLIFVHVITSGMPMALNMLVIANLHSDREGELAQFMFYGYFGVMFTLPVIGIFYLNYFLNGE